MIGPIFQKIINNWNLDKREIRQRTHVFVQWRKMLIKDVLLSWYLFIGFITECRERFFGTDFL